MEIVEEVQRSKWISLVIFLVLDVLQILFVSLLYLDESMPQIVGFDLARTNPLVSISLFVGISIAQFVIAYVFTMRTVKDPKMIQLYPSTGLKQKTMECRYSKQEIIDWTLDAAKKSGVSVSRIFVMPSPLPNAFTFSLPFIGASVVVHSNLLDVLRPAEVQAVIAHEVGHIKNKDSLISSFTRMPSFFVDVVYFYIYIRLGLGIATSLLIDFNLIWAGIRAIVLLIFFGFSRIVSNIAKRYVKKSSRKAELLADYHAATIIGHVETINGLVRLGQRVEAITALVEEIRWLESFNPERISPVSQQELYGMIRSYPLDGIDERNARDVAPWVFLTTRLRNLRDVYGVILDDEQIEASVSPAVKDLLEKREKEEEESSTDTEEKTIDWREADVDGDRHLSAEELTELLKILRENPTKFMFENEVGMNTLAVDHPDFGRRVIFVADCFGI